MDFGLLDIKGNLLGNPYHYRDSRVEGCAEIINRKLGNRELYDLTGIQLLSFNTVNQLVSMVENSDPSLNVAENLLFMGDLLHYFLTGEKVSEYTVASISQLYNTAANGWEKKIFDQLGIPFRLTTRLIKAGNLIVFPKTLFLPPPLDLFTCCIRSKPTAASNTNPLVTSW